jgi:hypothetical protein
VPRPELLRPQRPTSAVCWVDLTSNVASSGFLPLLIENLRAKKSGNWRFKVDIRLMFAFIIEGGCAEAERRSADCCMCSCRNQGRGEPIRPSPKLMSTIADAVQLARMVLREIER